VGRSSRVAWACRTGNEPTPAPHELDAASRVGDVLSGAACGTVGVMAMTGMRGNHDRGSGWSSKLCRRSAAAGVRHARRLLRQPPRKRH
jgi:hypothetical protein